VAQNKNTYFNPLPPSPFLCFTVDDIDHHQIRERLDAVLERMARLEEIIERNSTGNKTASPPERRSSTVTTVPPPEISQVEGSVLDGTSESSHIRESVEYTGKRKRRELSASSIGGTIAGNEDGRPTSRPRKDEEAEVAVVVDEDEEEEPEEGQSPEDKMLANIDLKRYLRIDRQNCDMDKERQSVIESAIRLAKSVAMANTQLELNRDSRPNFYDPSMYPTAEFLHLLMRGTSDEAYPTCSSNHFV